MSYTVENGRLGNQIIRNLCTSMVAERHNLYIEYCNFKRITSLGIDLFIGSCKHKNTVLLTDDNFFAMFYKKLEYFHVCMDGFFHFGYIYLKYKSYILHYMEQHKNEHFIQTDRNERFLMRDILDDLALPPEKQYDIATDLS